MQKAISLINKEIKIARRKLKEEQNLYSVFGIYEDCGEFYRENVIRAESHLSALIIIRGKIKKELTLTT